MFRFTIRDVLWLMAVVGLALGWFLARNRYATDLHFLSEAYMKVATASADARLQAFTYKKALEKAEAKLKAASEEGNDSN